ncbi:DUF2203 family protein [bacterium]|nr:DUF2203 family protein [bacterium]
MTATPQPVKPFTVATANRTLPLVRAIVSDIVTLHRDVKERKERLDALRKRRGHQHDTQPDLYREEVDQIQQDLHLDEDRLQSFVDELAEIGIALKDPSVGMVDFPTLMDGKNAFLSWSLGEPEVEFWHTTEAGSQVRQPIPNRPADHAV